MANINVENDNITIPGAGNIIAGQTFTIAFTLNNREILGGGPAQCQTAGVSGHIANVSVQVVYPDQSTDTVTGIARVNPTAHRKGDSKVCVPLDGFGTTTVEVDLVAPEPGEYGLVAQAESANTIKDSETTTITVLEPEEAEQPDDGSGDDGSGGGIGGGGGGGGDIGIPGGETPIGNGDGSGDGSGGSNLTSFIINRPVEAGVIGLSAAFIADRSISALFED